MNDIGKELYERVRADFERRLTAEKHPPKDMRGVSDYSARVGRYLAEAIAANVTEDALPDRRLYYNIAESILEPSLRANYELVNDTAAEVQRLLDERQGLRIKPARADYPEERVHAVIGAASEEGIDFGKALRRMTSPAENITQSFADDFMKANAEQRSKAGFDTFIERQGGFNCCPWCAGLVGVFAYPKGLPKEVFARHDNCTCSVTYGTKGGARQHVWSKQTWSSAQEREYLRIRDAEKKKAGGKRLTEKQVAAIREKVQAPHRLTKEQAAALGAFAQPRRLTGGANGGIINYRDSSITDHSVTPQIISNMPESTVFSGEIGERYNSECRNLLTHVMNSGAKAGTEFSIIFDEFMDRLEGHDYITGEDGHTIIEDADVLYHAFHNHGSDGMLSFSDLFNFSARSKQISISAVGNLGSNYILYTVSRNQDEISKSKEKYFFYLWRQSTKPIVQTSTGEKITFRKIMNNADGIRTIIQNLPETEQRQILKEVVSKTEEHIREGEKYGFKYYERRI